MGATNTRFEIATETEDCNACLFIKDCLEDIVPDISYSEKRAIVRARENNWQVQKGDMCRKYTWLETDEEVIECVEIPEIASICTEHDLWP